LNLVTVQEAAQYRKVIAQQGFLDGGTEDRPIFQDGPQHVRDAYEWLKAQLGYYPVWAWKANSYGANRTLSGWGFSHGTEIVKVGFKKDPQQVKTISSEVWGLILCGWGIPDDPEDELVYELSPDRRWSANSPYHPSEHYQQVSCEETWHRLWDMGWLQSHGYNVSDCEYLVQSVQPEDLRYARYRTIP